MLRITVTAPVRGPLRRDLPERLQAARVLPYVLQLLVAEPLDLRQFLPVGVDEDAPVRVVTLLGLLEGAPVVIPGEIPLVLEYRELPDAPFRRNVDDAICKRAS